METGFDLSHFSLWQAVFEIRYNDAFLLWDRSGQLWKSAKNKWPNLKNKDASPNATSFILDNRYEMRANINRANFMDMKPSSSLKDFMELSEGFMELTFQTLEISEYDRIGFRLIYVKNFPNKISAAKSMLATKMINIPKGKHFNIAGKVLLPSYSLVWEGESTAVRVTLRAQNKKIDIEVPPNIEEIKPVHLDRYELSYDVDYYTLSPVVKGQLKITEWLSGAYQLIKRDSKIFLGGC